MHFSWLQIIMTPPIMWRGKRARTKVRKRDRKRSWRLRGRTRRKKSEPTQTCTEIPKATKQLLLLMASYVSIWTSQIPSPYIWVKHRDSPLCYNKACPLCLCCQKQRASNHGTYPVTALFKRNLYWSELQWTGYDPVSKTQPHKQLHARELATQHSCEQIRHGHQG